MLRFHAVILFAFGCLLAASCEKKVTTTTHEPAAEPPQAHSAPAAGVTVASGSPVAQPAPAAAAPAAAAPAAPASAGPSAIATADGDKSGMTVEVRELKRGSGGIVSMKFTIVNNSDKDVGIGSSFADRDHENIDYGSIGGVQLLDPVGKKKYFVARDADGKCVCSTGVPEFKPGTSTNLWAKFPAPPDDVQKIGVIIPHFTPMDDVPISR